jgi:hypothetical protein
LKGSMRSLAAAALVLHFATESLAAEFASPGGPEPGGIVEVAQLLRSDAYDMELLVSFGTSKGGSAGHLALALRGEGEADDLVHSANFYADRNDAHARDFHTADLMLRIPKMEYLYRTTSTVGDKASFGLDFGQVYKRSVVGIRVHGVPLKEREALVAYFTRMNADYHARARNPEYHDGEVKYDYMHLNCAKTVGAAFRYGAGYDGLGISGTRILPGRTKMVAAATANIPTEMAMKLMSEWNARGYALDVVLYRKYPGAAYVDPRDEDRVAFKDLPDRFPSVRSLDFRNDAGHYEDYDNLLAMYLLHNLGRYAIRIEPESRRVEVRRRKTPLGYREALARAEQAAEYDSKGFLRRLLFPQKGKRVGDATDDEAPPPG